MRDDSRYACVYSPPAADQPPSAAAALVSIAQAFSPRYERHGDDFVSIDISGMDRLFGTPRAIAEELGRAARAHGVRVHVAVAHTRMAALVLAQSRPGVTLVDPGQEAASLASVRIEQLGAVLHALNACGPRDARGERARSGSERGWGPARGERKDGRTPDVVAVLRSWGLRTLGELAALPSADLASRLGQRGVRWQAIARGEDIRPLVSDVPEERFESTLDLEWPIEGLEPLSFVLTRLLEPLSVRLERRDRGAAALHVVLRLVSTHAGPLSTGADPMIHARRLELPSPLRDVRTLRTLALLDLESHPPAAPIDRVTVVIDPTPGRVWQHTLFTRAHPTPEQLSTLLARLGALMGQDRIGAPAAVDSYRPGVFAMKPFGVDHAQGAPHALSHASSTSGMEGESRRLMSALRRCRHPVPARVVVEHGRPVRVTADRRGFAGGRVTARAGPWRSSGEWWVFRNTREGNGPRTSGVGVGPLRRSVLDTREGCGPRASGVGVGPHAWDNDEWDVALSDGAVYRIFQDRTTRGWFIGAIVD